MTQVCKFKLTTFPDWKESKHVLEIGAIYDGFLSPICSNGTTIITPNGDKVMVLSNRLEAIDGTYGRVECVSNKSAK